MEELIRKKGMFPARTIRFCTQELKVKPMIAHLASIDDDVINAVGIRKAESAARAQMTEWEWSEGFDCETWRPLIDWTEQQVIDIHARHGLPPNPLYLMGATRVGCWPCINARKSEIRLIADVDPGRITQIRKLETQIHEAANARHDAAGKERRGSPAWFQKPTGVDRGACMPIDEVVKWARTSRGGVQYEMFAASAADAGCMRWGMCETDKP